jgi:hypothetical protein
MKDVPMHEFSDPTPIATVDAYIRALKIVRDSFRKGNRFSESKELRMLRMHYSAPGHTTTTTELAAQVGMRSFGVSNMQYGKLAHRIADALQYRPEPSETGTPHWWRTLAHGNNGSAPTNDGTYEWVMRPELCKALEDMGWVSSR